LWNSVSKKPIKKRTGAVAQGVSPCWKSDSSGRAPAQQCEALSSNSRSAKKKKRLPDNWENKGCSSEGKVCAGYAWGPGLNPSRKFKKWKRLLRPIKYNYNSYTFSINICDSLFSHENIHALCCKITCLEKVEC
jgi:hypothetical protein